MRLVQDSAEQIRRCEVSHVLKKVDHSPEGEEIMERLSHPLVGEPVWVHPPRPEPSTEGQPLTVGAKRVKVIVRDSAQEVSK
jgi:hypothetical protein